MVDRDWERERSRKDGAPRALLGYSVVKVTIRSDLRLLEEEEEKITTKTILLVLFILLYLLFSNSVFFFFFIRNVDTDNASSVLLSFTSAPLI